MTEKTFLSKDTKSTIHYYVWEPEGEPVAILQLVHGMAEHISRYAPLAEYLNQYGVLVCGNDHIGHGNSSKPEDWGYFGEAGGWKVMVQDVEQLPGIMKVQYMDTPYFILGHSMGSFITRAWLAMYGSGVDGVVIMGTAGTNKALGIAKFLVKVIRRFKGSRHLSKLITTAAFGSYNKRIKPGRTPYDWLTRDDAIVDKYIEDPACGFTFTTAGYADLFNVIGYVSSDQCYKLVPKDMPLLLVSGREDPVGAYGDGPAEVAERLQQAGCDDVSLILYEDMRHEILNEFGKETVMDDIRRFIFGEEAAGAEGADEPDEEYDDVDAATAEDAKDKAEEVFEEAKDKAEAFAAEVKDHAEEVKEAAEEYFEEAKEKAEDFAEEVKDKAEEVYEEVKDKAEEVFEEAKEKAEDFAEAAKDKAEDFAEAAKDKAEEAAAALKDAAGKFAEAEKQISEESGKATEDARWEQSMKSFTKVIEAAEAIGPDAAEAHSQAEAALADASGAVKEVKEAVQEAPAVKDVWVDLNNRQDDQA